MRANLSLKTRGQKTAASIRVAAVQLLATHGYDGMSLRQLAAAVEMQQGSLYNHFASKQQLLFQIIHDVMVQLLASFADDVLSIKAPLARLDAAVSLHITYHTKWRDEVYLASTELRSLEPENRSKITRLRREYENLFVSIISDGVELGLFEVPDVKIASYALIAMLTGVSQWYQPDGRLDLDQVIGTYRIVARRMLGAKIESSPKRR